jgi:glycosyltransferase involved in cell wall biosynthesis
MLPENRILAVSSMYNVEEWIGRTINSVLKQEYSNYKYILVDDVSTDKTVEIVKRMTENIDNIEVITNSTKKYSLQNIYEGIRALDPQKEDIILTLDGDDWLAGTQVFETINEKYNETDCWMTWGSYLEFPQGMRGIESSAYPIEELRNENFDFRKGKWRVSHLRTFKYGLFEKIKYEDFLDWNGEFYKTSIDKAFMYPMIEMARERSEFIDDILYVYNFNNPLNVHKARRELQLKTSHYLKEMKQPYSKIREL